MYAILTNYIDKGTQLLDKEEIQRLDEDEKKLKTEYQAIAQALVFYVGELELAETKRINKNTEFTMYR